MNALGPLLFELFGPILRAVAAQETGGEIVTKNVNKDDSETVDMTLYRRYFTPIFGVMDYTKCEIPTTSCLQKGFEYCDSKFEYKLSGFQPVSARKEWARFTAEQFHDILSGCNKQCCRPSNTTLALSIRTLAFRKKRQRDSQNLGKRIKH